MNDEQLKELIERVCSEYHGQLDHLYQAVGLLVVGQLYGWRVMRLISTRPNWRKASALFGDLKTLMPERGPLAHKSIGLKISDDLGHYWEIIQGW